MIIDRRQPISTHSTLLHSFSKLLKSKIMLIRLLDGDIELNDSEKIL